MKWAIESDLSLKDFGKSSLDTYLSIRLDAGISRTTMRHDALCAKVFRGYIMGAWTDSGRTGAAAGADRDLQTFRAMTSIFERSLMPALYRVSARTR